MNEDEILRYTYTFTILSILLSIFFILILNTKTSSYAKLVSQIVIGEATSLFCSLLFLFEEEKINIKENISLPIIKTYLFFIDFTDNNETILKNFFSNLNKASYYSFEVLSLSLSIFLCIEIILVLKNPIAQIKNRLNIYFFFSYIIFIIFFFLTFLENKKEKINNLENNESDFDLFYKEKFFSYNVV